MNVAIQNVDPSSLIEATGNYTHGTVVSGAQRTLFVSGQPPWTADGSPVPSDFEAQCRLAWRNVLAVLSEAEMGVENLVKVTTFLSDRQYRGINSEVRAEILGDHRPALTIIITGIYDEEWLLEIEAVAVA
jgi:enamine deaminase RidA (YjgF/YER057c/UK114 family)